MLSPGGATGAVKSALIADVNTKIPGSSKPVPENWKVLVSSGPSTTDCGDPIAIGGSVPVSRLKFIERLQ